MTPLTRLASSCLVAAMALGLSATASLADPTPGTGKSRAPCFFTSQWQGWKAPNDRTLYLGVNNRDIYRVELSGSSPELQGPGVHLVFKARGSSSICSPLDLDLSVSDGHGFHSPLIARSLTKLTPEEVAAIPRKDRP
jgi:hypothetical protein